MSEPTLPDLSRAPFVRIPCDVPGKIAIDQSLYSAEEMIAYGLACYRAGMEAAAKESNALILNVGAALGEQNPPFV